MTLPAKIFIREVGLREGLQINQDLVRLSDKLALVEALNRTGLKELELTAFVNPERVPQMADAAELCSQFQVVKDIRYTALYLNQQGFLRAIAQAKLSLQGWLYTAASDAFLKANQNSSQQKFFDALAGWLELFAEKKVPLHGAMISCAFGCHYEGHIPSAKVVALVENLQKRLADAGLYLQELSLADTVGMASPASVSKLITAVKGILNPQTEISLHLHDTRGLGLVNAYAGLQQGIRIFDTSIGGVGGCPFTAGAAGNIATEDLGWLCQELGIETGLSLQACKQAALLMEKVIGKSLPGRFYRSP